jgi:small subunit ribosomal protein S20
MANIHSQKKRILRAERERLENRRYTSTIKTYFRRLEAAVAAGDDETADAEHRELVRRSTRPSSAARCTATPARARSPAPRA